MHAVRAIESHEIAHWRGNELPAARHLHVGICIGDYGIAGAVDDLAVNRREVIPFLLDYLERAGLGQMAGASARDRTREHEATTTDEIRHLLLQIDFYLVA